MLYIAADREVAIIGQDIIVLNQLGQIVFILAVDEKIHDLVLVFRQQQVLVAILLEELAGIDEEDTCIRLGTLLQHDDAGGDAYTKEEV